MTPFPVCDIQPRVLSRADFLARRFKSGKPVRHVVIDGFLKPACAGADPLGPGVLKRIEAAFRSAEFLDFVGKATGLTGWSLADPDGELGPRSPKDAVWDFTLQAPGGNLKVLFYGDPRYRNPWGRSLKIDALSWIKLERGSVRCILPVQNRLILAETPPSGAQETLEFPIYAKRTPENLNLPCDLTILSLRRLEKYELFSVAADLLRRNRPGKRSPSLPTQPVGTEAAELRAPCNGGLAGILNPAVLAGEDRLARKFAGGKPFEHVVVDDFLRPEFFRRLACEFPASAPERFIDKAGDLAMIFNSDVDSLKPSFRELDAAVQSDEFLGFLERIARMQGLVSDPRYLSSGALEAVNLSECNPHMDFTRHPETGFYRRLHFILYLNPEWKSVWGGALRLHPDPWLKSHRDRVRSIPPLPNRAVIFQASDHSWHSVERIRLPLHHAQKSRRAFVAFLYSRNPPQGLSVVPFRSTTIVRPLPKSRNAAALELLMLDQLRKS